MKINRENEGKLTHEFILSIFNYDPITGIITRKIRRGNRRAGSIVGVLNKNGYLETEINDICYQAHRLIWFYVYKVWPKELIDHINGNTADNTLTNLRECTILQNSQNRSKPKNNTSGFKGVSFYKKLDKWVAHLGINGTQKHLGYYVTPEEASEAYNKAAKELHGEFYKDTTE